MADIANLVHVTVTPEWRTHFLEVLLENARHAREEEGCKLFHVTEAHDRPNNFVFYEVFTSRQALDGHREQPHFKRYLAMIEEAGDNVTREFEVYNVVDS